MIDQYFSSGSQHYENEMDREEEYKAGVKINEQHPRIEIDRKQLVLNQHKSAIDKEINTLK